MVGTLTATEKARWQMLGGIFFGRLRKMPQNGQYPPHQLLPKSPSTATQQTVRFQPLLSQRQGSFPRSPDSDA